LKASGGERRDQAACKLSTKQGPASEKFFTGAGRLLSGNMTLRFEIDAKRKPFRL